MNYKVLKEGETQAWETMLHLLILGGAKLIAFFFTGITVLITDAISSFADILGVFASYIGLKLSRKSADKNFEYGYYKVETLAAFFISLGIIYLGYVVFFKSIEILKHPETGSFYPFAITITVLAILHSNRLYKKLKKASDNTNSLSLLANAKDKKMDMFAGIAILISIIANYKGIPYVEGIVSLVISLFILKEGIYSAKEAVFFLLDYWGDPFLSRKIKKILTKEKEIVQKVKKLRLRRAGTFVFGEAFIEINPFISIIDLRDELDFLKQKIMLSNPYIKDFAIFTSINKYENEIIAIPIKEGKDLNATLATNLKETKTYIFIKIKNNKIHDFKIKKVDKKDPVSLAEFLLENKVNILIDNKLHSLIYYNLRKTHHVLVYPNFPDVKTAKKTIELLLLDL
ncbi:MAG: cation diffusion facilitator family transporter [Candidatus Gracilibacteria bacterium]|jgi:cation diffusion facilitator family transporter